ncbi:MAG: arylsulfatase [Planctomycetes bacterium]|nr:arylsulfatase [Planctomycetota bacterium]
MKYVLHSLIATIACGLCTPASFGQSALNRAVRFADHMEPSIPHEEQTTIADEKLEALKKSTGKRPNIVWLLVDDMGYGDPGCYGGGITTGAATPNMDRLAREGIRLTSCYAQNTCTPTRSAMLTGRLPVRTGLTRPILAGDKLTVNPWEGESSLPKILEESGYNTLLVGKWHIGSAPGMRPHEIGFDEHFGYYGAQKETSQAVDPSRYPDLILDAEKFQRYQAIGEDNGLMHGFADGTLEEVSTVDSIEDMARADKVLTDFSVQKILELSKSDKPFFLEHAFMKVHTDDYAHPDFVGMSASKYPYKDALCEVDMEIGMIVQALEDAGVLENTFISVTSDNGPQMDGWPDSGYTPFRGAKGTTWEGGVRVPGIAYWKGMIKPGRESDDVFDLMDLFNTSLHIAGAESMVPKGRYIDGIDQTSFLLHDQGQGNRECVFFWFKSNLMAIRMREYKSHVKVILPHSNLMHIDMATLEDTGTAPWLFNLYIDPKEELAVGHRMNAWLASLGAELAAHAATFKKYPPKNVGL